ncbi:PBP1 and LysM peptidoglycan-binding domain-containing protein [Sediminicola luteus]|nr:LysM peptidoglycan-binding domain-containing protein [Sediminicola luteus]
MKGTRRILFVLGLFMGMAVSAQQFITHAVKEGETLYSIAKKYRVTPYNILKQNKELKEGDALQPNTLLVIPMGGVQEEAGQAQDSTKTAAREPIGYTKHRVRRRETLFGITKRYQITEVELKRYNPQLYANSLKKGMQLKIPKYLRVAPEDLVVEETEWDTYIVKPKETFWSIAYTHGITVDSLRVLNPQLEDILPMGEALKVPKKLGSTIEDQSVALYQSYTVPAKMTFFSLGQEFGVTEEQIKELNPEVVERGLQEGMIIRLPKPEPETEVVNTENYNFYEVKPKQTEFSLTRQLGISYTDLLALNPDLSEGLKAGMILKLPKDLEGDFEVKNALILDKVNLLDSINPMRKPKVLFLLPFRLDKIDVGNTEKAKKSLQGRRDAHASLGLYSGAMIALDSVNRLGISVDVKTLDTRLSQGYVKEQLSTELLSNYDAIVGPLTPKALDEVAARASVFNVPVIAPAQSSSDISHANVFYSVPKPEMMRERLLEHVSAAYTDAHVIVIADAANKKTDSLIHQRFPNAKSLQLKENLSLNIDDLTAAVSDKKPNWVFLESDNFRVVSSVVSILNSVRTEEVAVKLFTTHRGKGFENPMINSSHLSQLQFTYPSAYKQVGTNAFTQRYLKRFGTEPDRYAIRGFDLTYDLLLKLAYKPALGQVTDMVGETVYNGNKFDYWREGFEGYSNKASYILEFSEMRVKEIEAE